MKEYLCPECGEDVTFEVTDAISLDQHKIYCPGCVTELRLIITLEYTKKEEKVEQGSGSQNSES